MRQKGRKGDPMLELMEGLNEENRTGGGGSQRGSKGAT